MVAVRIQNAVNGKFSLGISRSNETEAVGFPRELVIDLSLFDVTNETMLIASLIAFPNSVEGRLITTPPVQHELLQRITDAGGRLSSSTRWLTEDRNVDYQNVRRNTLIIGTAHDDLKEFNIEGPGRRINAIMLDSSEWVGRLFGPNDVYFSTNAALLESNSSVSGFGLKVAIGVLLANDWQIGKMVIPINGTDGDLYELKHFRALLSAIGCELSVVSSDDRESGLYEEA